MILFGLTPPVQYSRGSDSNNRVHCSMMAATYADKSLPNNQSKHSNDVKSLENSKQSTESKYQKCSELCHPLVLSGLNKDSMLFLGASVVCGSASTAMFQASLITICFEERPLHDLWDPAELSLKLERLNATFKHLRIYMNLL